MSPKFTCSTYQGRPVDAVRIEVITSGDAKDSKNIDTEWVQ